MSGSEFYAPQSYLPTIPNDLTIPQFVLDSYHPWRPICRRLTPWLIEDTTGREVGYEEVRAWRYSYKLLYSGSW